MESPANKDYLQRPDRNNAGKKHNGSDEEQEDDLEDHPSQKLLDRNKKQLYEKPMSDIGRLPFFKGDVGEEEPEERDEGRSPKNKPKQKKRDDSLGGGFGGGGGGGMDDFGGFGDDF
jgi:hypothetical protein